MSRKAKVENNTGFGEQSKGLGGLKLGFVKYKLGAGKKQVAIVCVYCAAFALHFFVNFFSFYTYFMLYYSVLGVVRGKHGCAMCTMVSCGCTCTQYTFSVQTNSRTHDYMHIKVTHKHTHITCACKFDICFVIVGNCGPLSNTPCVLQWSKPELHVVNPWSKPELRMVNPWSKPELHMVNPSKVGLE